MFLINSQTTSLATLGVQILNSKDMSLYELLSLIVSLLGFTAVAVSLYFLVHQTRLLVQSVKCDTYASVTGNLATTKQIFIEHPQLRQYFYSGVEISEEAGDDYRKALSISEHLLDFFDGVLLQGLPLWPKHVWEKYIIDCFSRSPILRDYLQQNSEWYTPQLVKLMERAAPLSPSEAADARHAPAAHA